MKTIQHILMFCLMVSSALVYAQTPVPSAKDTAIFKQLDSLLIKIDKHLSQKQYAEALQLIDSASVIAESNYGRMSRAYSGVLHYKGKLYYSRREFSMAEPFWAEEERIKCALQETQGEKCMYAKQNLALLLRTIGKLDSASVKFNETKTLYEQLQIRDWGYAQLLNSIGNLMCDLGRFEQAIDVFQKSDTLLLQLKGRESPNNWLVRNGLATAYYKSGNYELAEHIITDIRPKQKEASGEKNNLYVGMTLLLANIYNDLGHYEAAIQLLLQAKSIREDMGMQEKDVYANVLVNLANNYTELLQYDTAILYYRSAVGIYEKEYGRHHPSYLLARRNEGTLHAKKGNLDTAEVILREVLVEQKASTGFQHPSVAEILYNLADVYTQKNDLIISDSILGLAIDIQKNTLEDNSQDYVQSLRYAAIISQRMEENSTAVGRYQKALTHYRNLLVQSSKYQTEFQLGIYTSKRLSDIHDLVFSFLQNTPDLASLLVPTAYDQILLQKGFLLYTSSQVRLWAKRDTFGAKATYEDFISVKRQLGSEYLKPIAERQNLPELEARADSLEKVLVRTVAGLGEALRQVNWQEVQAQLRPGEAAVEFVHYRYYDPKVRPTDSTLYAALVLLPGDTAPRFVPLCEARQIKAVVQNAGSDQLFRFQELYNTLDQPTSRLYPLVWQPLEAYLQGVQTVYYSPSGMLHTLNLSAIQPVKRETLSDRYRMVALVSTRQLVVPTNVSPADSTAVVFGGIRYEMDSTKIAEANRDYSNASDSLATHNSESIAHYNNSLRGGSWPYLPQTRVEAINISNLLKRYGFQTSTRLDFSATEEFVKRLGSNKKPSPHVLHFATHGFFLQEQASQARQRNGQATDFTLWGDKGTNNPMFRSGIFLAGAKHSWETGKPLEGMEDGILTAYEVSQMDLMNTDLVVLAACMTGLGDIQGNEGVYGLQRAFKIAGVRYVLMTLWEVPEPETQELVESFYTKWLVRGLPVPDAFRAAQKEMRGVYPNPYYWAGFVLVE